MAVSSSQQLPTPLDDAVHVLPVGTGQDGCLPLADVRLQLLQVGHIPVDEPHEKAVQQLLVLQRPVRRHLAENGVGLVLRRPILAKDKQVLPIQIQQHLFILGAIAVYVIPVKGDQAEFFKALKALDLPLV